MSPAIHGPVTVSKWTDAYVRANCAHCKWTTDRGGERVVLKDAHGHAAENPGHTVAVDRGQTRYVKSAA